MIFDFHVPHYFSKGVRPEIEELSISSALADLAVAMVTIFEPIFLYSVLHFSVQEVLLFTAAVYTLYILLIPFGAKVASLYGYEHSIAFSIPFQILYWILVMLSQSSPHLIYFAPLAFAIEKTLFWPGFHAIVARYGSTEQKGREFSLIYAIFNITQMLGPFIGGWLALKFGIGVSFIVAGAIYVSSAVPLLWTKEVFIPKLYSYRDTWELFKQHPKKFIGYIGFGEEHLGMTVWPIFIFLVVKNYEETGILASIASLAAAVSVLIIGKITDSYTKKVLIKVGALFTALGWGMKFIVNSFWSASALDAFSRTAKDVVFIPLSTLTYLRAEASHILPYVVFFEQSLSIGKLIAALLGIMVFTVLGGGIAGFTGVFLLAALFSLLYMLV